KTSLWISPATRATKRESIQVAAQPGWQISGEVVIRLRNLDSLSVQSRHSRQAIGPRSSCRLFQSDALRQSTLYFSRLTCMYRGQPSVGVRARSIDDAEEFLLQALGDRSSTPLADGDAVDGADRGDLRGGAGKEDFVRDVEHLARNDRLHHGDVEFARQV